MNRIALFLKTTLLGGVVVVLPIYFSVLLLARALRGAFALLEPVTNQIPASIEFRQLVALLIVIALCFLTGVVVRTGPGIWVKKTVDRYFFEHLPGYPLIRGMTGRLVVGQNTTADQNFSPALVDFDDGQVVAFVMDRHDDGRYTVFVPSVPTPAAGTLYIMDPARVHPLDVPFTRALSVITRWGAGSRELVKALSRAENPPA
jgi:uncharacterized membrane protein